MDWERITPLILQFGVGAIMCAVGLWTGLSSGYLEKGSPTTRNVIAVVIGGYAGLLALVSLFTFVLPYWGAGGNP